MISSIIQALFLKKSEIQTNMSGQEKKQQRIYDLINAGTKTFHCLPYTEQRTIFLKEKELFKRKREWRIEPKTKRKLFKSSLYGN